MGNRNHHPNNISATKVVMLMGVSILITIPARTYSTSSLNTISSSRNIYQPQPPPQYNSLVNISSGIYSNARDGGSSYSAPISSSSYGNSGGYGAPMEALPIPIVYQYQHHQPMKMQSYGWAGGNDDDGDLDFPTELIGLLGLKGLKGLKGLVGLVGLLKGLLALKKLLLLPLLLLLLPLLIPLFLLKLLLILLLPVPVITTTAGRRNLQDKLESVLTKLPQDIGHILDKIKISNGDLSWNKFVSGRFDDKSNKQKSEMGDMESSKNKTVYINSKDAPYIKPSGKLAKFVKHKE